MCVIFAVNCSGCDTRAHDDLECRPASRTINNNIALSSLAITSSNVIRLTPTGFSSVIAERLCTLQRAFETVASETGFNIEIKYPSKREADESSLWFCISKL